MRSARWIAIVLMTLACQLRAVAQPAEDSLAAARQLYAEAAYEDALSMLDRLEKAAGTRRDRSRHPADARAVPRGPQS